jgi:hypothetical protein
MYQNTIQGELKPKKIKPFNGTPEQVTKQLVKYTDKLPYLKYHMNYAYVKPDGHAYATDGNRAIFLPATYTAGILPGYYHIDNSLNCDKGQDHWGNTYDKLQQPLRRFPYRYGGSVDTGMFHAWLKIAKAAATLAEETVNPAVFVLPYLEGMNPTQIDYLQKATDTFAFFGETQIDFYYTMNKPGSKECIAITLVGHTTGIHLLIMGVIKGELTETPKPCHVLFTDSSPRPVDFFPVGEERKLEVKQKPDTYVATMAYEDVKSEAMGKATNVRLPYAGPYKPGHTRLPKVTTYGLKIGYGGYEIEQKRENLLTCLVVIDYVSDDLKRLVPEICDTYQLDGTFLHQYLTKTGAFEMFGNDREDTLNWLATTCLAHARGYANSGVSVATEYLCYGLEALARGYLNAGMNGLATGIPNLNKKVEKLFAGRYRHDQELARLIDGIQWGTPAPEPTPPVEPEPSPEPEPTIDEMPEAIQEEVQEPEQDDTPEAYKQVGAYLVKRDGCTIVKGNTYPIRTLLRADGYSFDKALKAWVKYETVSPIDCDPDPVWEDAPPAPIKEQPVFLKPEIRRVLNRPTKERIDVPYIARPDKPGTVDDATAYKRTIIKKYGIKADVFFEQRGPNLWVKGNTYPIRAHLKAEGFRWAATKKGWYKSVNV